MRVIFDGERVVKTAESKSERMALGREASALRALAHPGVVGLITTVGDHPPEQLVTRFVAGCTLADVGPQPVETVGGWAAALATTLADLHETGWAHGAVAAEHVVLDGQGRPVLCGFSRAGRDRDAAGDVTALAGMILARLPSSADRRLVRGLSRAAYPRGTGRPFVTPPSARSIARLIVDRVPGARLSPVGSTGSGDPIDLPPATVPAAGHSRRRTLVAVAAAAVLGGVVLLLGFGRSRPAATPRGWPPPNPGAPESAAGRIYQIDAAPGERPLSVQGRWGCGPERPAVLDESSGTVWVFPRWPAAPGSGAAVAGRFVGRVAGGTGLAVVASGQGCDRLEVLRGSLPAETVSVGAGS